MCSIHWRGVLLTVACRFDKEHNIRKTLVESLKKEFPDYGLT